MKDQRKNARSVYNSEAQVASRLEMLETGADLFKYQIDGYSVWRLLRFKMAMILHKLPFYKQSKPFGAAWVLERMILFVREIPIFLFPVHKDIVVKTFSTALSDEENGFFRDVYFDDLLDDGKTCFKIETLNNPGYAERRKKALIPITMTTALVDLISAVFAFVRMPAHTHRLAADIYKDLQPEFQDFALTVKDIQISILRFYWSKRLYKRLLTGIKPKITLSANTGEFAFWAASKELGIPAIEFQHGVFTRAHPNSLNSTMNNYRDRLITADKILLFGEYWHQLLQLNQYYRGELAVVGSPRIDRYRMVRKNNVKVLDRVGNKSILFSSQGLDVERLIAFLREFMDVVDPKIKYTLYIKLHPAERDKTPYLLGFKEYPQVNILYGFELPSTFDLLARADLHISIASTVHYDALGLFVPTAVLPLTGHEVVQNLVDAGHALAVKTPQDLADLVLNIRDYEVSQDVSYYYYEPNAVQNIKREMSLLIK